MINLQYYSQEEEIFDPLFTEKKVRVFVKRDDLIHPFISGNKWRKLKYSLQNARETNKNHLITFGGAYSNHLLATAAAAAKFGFKATGFVRGEMVENEMLMLCRLFGMQLIFTERKKYLNKQKLFDDYFGHDVQAFFIDEGGAGFPAVKGCAELIVELKNSYNHIFCACGTGTTAAGILKSINQNHLKTMLHAVPVLKNGSFIQKEIEKYTDNISQLKLHLDYHFGGYAKTKPELLEFIRRFASATGILLDPVYTGKLLFALYNLIALNYFSPGSKILAIHTGGLYGILGMTEKFRQNIL